MRFGGGIERSGGCLPESGGGGGGRRRQRWEVGEGMEENERSGRVFFFFREVRDGRVRAQAWRWQSAVNSPKDMSI